MSNRTTKTSSARGAGFDTLTRTLEVEFLDGSVYQYYGIPHDLQIRIMQAPFKGPFLDRHIRDSYPYARVAWARRTGDDGMA